MIIVTNNEGVCGIGATSQLLAEGRPCLDAIEAGIRLVEENESVRTVGRGGWPNLLGEVELDASVMDGTTLRTGSVGAIQGFLHPVSIARQIKERLPHEMLVGEGAARFAREIGAEQSDNLIPDSKAVWKKWFAEEVDESQKRDWPNVPLTDLCKHAIDPEVGRDTTVFLGQDKDGNIAVGTSTSGWGWKYPGRLGDSPIIGAGSYADTRYGACACTGTGEMTIRAGTARSVVLYMKMGLSVQDAVYAAVEDMRALKGGLISRVTIHAVDNKGNHKVVAVNGNSQNTYCIWSDGMPAPESRPAEIIVITTSESKPTASLRFSAQRL
jgi:L-asparaginase